VVRILLILVITFIFTGVEVSAQQELSLSEIEMELKALSNTLNKGSNDSVRSDALKEFIEIIESVLVESESFSYAFDSIAMLSKLKSPDERFRIYTWVVPSIKDKEYKYFGYVQLKDPSSGLITLIELKDTINGSESLESSILDSENWFGAVYYDLFYKKVKKDYYYYLLGWKGNDARTTTKVIEVLTVSDQGGIKFGAPVFEGPGKVRKSRVVFNYASGAVMVLRHEKSKKRIVFDHLSPSVPNAKGDYRFYGPDFTYEGYRYKKGKWYFVKDLDLRN